MNIAFRPVVLLLCFSCARFAAAEDTYNPTPATLESPADDLDAVTKRLTADSEGKTPVVKNLAPAWIQGLGVRGEPTLYTKDNSHDFDYLGMPVGGIGAGELYLSGDGRLWDWDIFGTRCKPTMLEQGLAYVTPHVVAAPNDTFQTLVNQGFVIRTSQGGTKDTRVLDKSGFSKVTFSGQYPIGTVDYTDPGSPVHVRLDAFSPFIPGDLDDSSYPSTILAYTVENTSSSRVDFTLGGWLENAVGNVARHQYPVLLQDTASKQPGLTVLNLTSKEVPPSANPPTLFDGFESGKYDHWKAEGTAFADRPSRVNEFRHAMSVFGEQGKFMVDSFSKGDQPTGTLTSESFVISRPYVLFLIGGGNDPQNECVNLLVDGKPVRTATGSNDETLRLVSWDVKEFAGKSAQFQIQDQSSKPWGHILADQFEFSDSADDFDVDKARSDIGSMALAVVGDGGEVVAQVPGDKASSACLDATAADTAESKASGDTGGLVGAVRATRSLNPGEKVTVSFILGWYFPNPLSLGLQTPTVRKYATRFKSAEDVVAHVAGDLDRLSAQTHAWRDSWYDSTLPYYFLDRTFLNVSTLACSTSYLLSDGRFYGYEGRYSCQGTCTHVWGYQQAIGYLFPDIEKSIMEKVEFVPGLGMNDNGGVAMRAEFDRKPPVDGQAGIVLRSYLADRMSTDHAFLQRNYQSIKKAINFLVDVYDPNHTGIMSGPQANTMDAAWYGQITWLSLHYQAALRAAAQMADRSDDAAFGQSLREIADKGRLAIETNLFNGQYFIQIADPAHPDSPGTYVGCPIEQLMGQNWAYEVGLGDIIDHGKALTALNSIWKYDYTTDAGLYRKSFPKGRWYAMAGESGLIMCSFPEGGQETLNKGTTFFSAYDNETWAGSEYEATALLMWDGMVDKALAEIRSVNDRYDGAKRNPWDETECGSHYSRSMASYGVFIAACGYEYDGPQASMAFAPRVNPENFKAAFTSAEGWGSYSQTYSGKGMTAMLALRHGQLRLKTLSLALPPGSTSQGATVQLAGKDQGVAVTRKGDRLSLAFSSDLNITEGQTLQISTHP